MCSIRMMGVRRFSDFAEGRKQMLDTLAGYWPWWLRLKKRFPNDYEKSCSPFFKLIFFEVYLQVLKHNFMLQYFHPAYMAIKYWNIKLCFRAFRWRYTWEKISLKKGEQDSS